MQSYLFTPYGEPWVTENPAIDVERKFTGHTYDKESKMYYMNARYMDPNVGVFITLDPSMSGLNHYNYCSANPVNYTDPTGLDMIDLNPNSGWNSSSGDNTISFTLFSTSWVTNNKSTTNNSVKGTNSTFNFDLPKSYDEIINNNTNNILSNPISVSSGQDALSNIGDTTNLSTKPLEFSDWLIYKGFKAKGKIWPGGLHFGLDLINKNGNTLNAPVGAFIAGKLYSVNTDSKKDTGLEVILQHTDKYGNTYFSSYQHLNSIDDSIKKAFINGEKNKTIKVGQLLGYAGATGHADGVHLHFDISFYKKLPSQYIFSDYHKVTWPSGFIMYYMKPSDFGVK